MRSLLFVPGHDPRKLAKGLESAADALILDLEDAVPEAEKARARALCADFVAQHHQQKKLIVRVNALATGWLLDDLAVVVRAQPFAVMLPKCTGAKDVALVGHYLSALEKRDALAPGLVRIFAIATESAESLFETRSYQDAGARLAGLMWGGEDLAADIGATANRDAEGHYTAPYQLARTLTLLGATSAGVAAIDAVYTNFRDADGLRAECADALRDGFSGKAAIHPDQVAVINAAFSPSEADLTWARRVLAAFDAQPAAGAVALDGRMLDRPHYRSAQRVLARAGVAGAA